MSFSQVKVVDIVTASDGTATGYTPVVSGQVASISYVADGSVPFTNTVDFTITTETTGQGLWTESNIAASKTVAPRQPSHDQVGAAALYAAGGTAVGAPIYACAERVKIALAQGGDTKRGQFRVVIA